MFMIIIIGFLVLLIGICSSFIYLYIKYSELIKDIEELYDMYYKLLDCISNFNKNMSKMKIRNKGEIKHA